MPKTSKILCFVGSALLLTMAAFHGSGYSYVSELISASNAQNFIKKIVPPLFLHTSIHLVGLAAFGIVIAFQKETSRKLLIVLSLVIVADAIVAFALGGAIAGGLLFAAAFCFVVAGVR